MILTCPQCATRYQVDGAKFPAAGRNVRCAKCGHVWHQLGPAEEPDPDAEIEVQEPPPAAKPIAESPAALRAAAFAAAPPIAPQPVAVTEERSGRWLDRAALFAGWALLVALILLVGWAAIALRDSIATWIPQTSSIYNAAGLPVNRHGMDFADVKYERRIEDGQVVLSVTGNIVNRSSHELPVPTVRVGLYDADKHELYHWTFTPTLATLKPGQTCNFRTRLSSPPAGIHDMEVRFARTGE
ncbi:MAG TPA: DUF3426 domain-containing protein [Rhizomicrobium sp.]|nr:DUF3426 domain-containing protein [Rhizomicrobium sp.]